jgi:Cu/Ag efflux protein CusF
LIFSLISVVKAAQETWKKTKIINMVDEEHKKTEIIKDDIKKWLFDR